MNMDFSRRNFYAFLWHSVFLALSSNFMNIDTIIPSLLIKAGGTNFDLGILTAILIGLSPFAQLFFGAILAPYKLKKKFLLLGIYIRILSLLSLSYIIFKSDSSGTGIIFALFVIIAFFSLSGGFAGISYTDILGKAINSKDRKKFFSVRQTITSIGLLISSIAVKKFLVLFNFPKNYAFLFFFAFVLLFTASIGFWVIKEPESKIKNKTSTLTLFKNLPSFLKKDKNLLLYLLIINFISFFIATIPFFIMYLKNYHKITGAIIGNLLIAKILGMILAGIILHYMLKKGSYKTMLLITMPIGVIIPIAAFFLVNSITAYIILFFFLGMFFSAFSIANSGILIEISNEDNRSVYTGLAGAGNIIAIIYPLLAGFFVKQIGYMSIFIFSSVMLLISIIFIKELNCQKITNSIT